MWYEAKNNNLLVIVGRYSESVAEDDILLLGLVMFLLRVLDAEDKQAQHNN